MDCKYFKVTYYPSQVELEMEKKNRYSISARYGISIYLRSDDTFVNNAILIDTY